MPPDGVTIERGILEAAKCPAGPQSAQADLVSWQPRRILLKSYAESRAIVPVAEVYAPGWKATTDDGAAVPIVPVNVGQRALVVPAGPRFIAMRYEPFSYRLGAFLSLTTLSLIASLGAARWMRSPLCLWCISRWRRTIPGLAPPAAVSAAQTAATEPHRPATATHDEPAAAQESRDKPQETSEKPQDQRYWDVGL